MTFEIADEAWDYQDGLREEAAQCGYDPVEEQDYDDNPYAHRCTGRGCTVCAEHLQGLKTMYPDAMLFVPQDAEPPF